MLHFQYSLLNPQEIFDICIIAWVFVTYQSTESGEPLISNSSLQVILARYLLGTKILQPEVICVVSIILEVVQQVDKSLFPSYRSMSCQENLIDSMVHTAMKSQT